MVQLRAKNMSASELESETAAWVRRLAGTPTLVIVNDRLDVALAAGAAGVHLGPDDLPIAAARRIAPAGFLLGASAHDREELLAAQAGGADYAGLGAFFASETKPEARPLDPVRAGVSEAIPGLAIPVLAIGGIDAGRVAKALSVPAVNGIAVSRAVAGAEDPARAIAELRAALDRAWAERCAVEAR